MPVEGASALFLPLRYNKVNRRSWIKGHKDKVFRFQNLLETALKDSTSWAHFRPNMPPWLYLQWWFGWPTKRTHAATKRSCYGNEILSWLLSREYLFLKHKSQRLLFIVIWPWLMACSPALVVLPPNTIKVYAAYIRIGRKSCLVLFITYSYSGVWWGSIFSCGFGRGCGELGDSGWRRLLEVDASWRSGSGRKFFLACAKSGHTL